MNIEDPTETPKAAKACVGVLYFSQYRYDAQRRPICSGFRQKLKPTDEAAQLPTETIPGGSFKYLCVGYSAYDEEQLKRSAAGRTSSSDAVRLPYCEGLEIVSAAATHRPGLLAEGPSPDISAAETDGANIQQRPGRAFLPGAGTGPPELPEFNKFIERFERISWKIVQKMESNMQFMMNNVKKGLQKVWTEDKDGGKEK